MVKIQCACSVVMNYRVIGWLSTKSLLSLLLNIMLLPIMLMYFCPRNCVDSGGDIGTGSHVNKRKYLDILKLYWILR